MMADGTGAAGARFIGADLSGAVFRDVDLRRAKIVDALLDGAEVSGSITGLQVNGVEVAPLVEAELDRRHPERQALRATTPAGLRTGWAMVEEMWRPTIARAELLPEAALQERVDEEWSLTETLRHLVFVIDAWFGRAVRGERHPYHALGLPPSFLGDAAVMGIAIGSAASFTDALGAHHQCMRAVAAYLRAVTEEELQAPRPGNAGAGYPPPTDHTVLGCLHVIMDEEWWHHQYAVRDLAVLTSRTG
jgi:hypothetical protein